jgi:hypothetical protein
MVMGNLETMQLKDELPSRDQPLVLAAAVCAFAVEEALVPPAAGFDIRDGDEWLGPNLSLHAAIMAPSPWKPQKSSRPASSL